MTLSRLKIDPTMAYKSLRIGSNISIHHLLWYPSMHITQSDALCLL
jgi:hypothetical protein